jgi:hypothetical protein
MDMESNKTSQVLGALRTSFQFQVHPQSPVLLPNNSSCNNSKQQQQAAAQGVCKVLAELLLISCLQVGQCSICFADHLIIC